MQGLNVTNDDVHIVYIHCNNEKQIWSYVLFDGESVVILAFKFCLKYSRKTEFRKLCDIVS